MSNSPEDAERRKVVVYQCPAPGCDVTTGGIEEMNDHVNDKHEGEWDDPDWPTPEEDAEW